MFIFPVCETVETPKATIQMLNIGLLTSQENEILSTFHTWFDE